MKSKGHLILDECIKTQKNIDFLASISPPSTAHNTSPLPSLSLSLSHHTFFRFLLNMFVLLAKQLRLILLLLSFLFLTFISNSNLLLLSYIFIYIFQKLKVNLVSFPDSQLTQVSFPDSFPGKGKKREKKKLKKKTQYQYILKVLKKTKGLHLHTVPCL